MRIFALAVVLVGTALHVGADEARVRINIAPAEPVDSADDGIRDHRRDRQRRVIFFPVRERVIYRDRPEAVYPVARPVPEPEPEVFEPLDPAGSARHVRARGAGTGPRFAPGDTLPSNLPHVTLDPVRFGLPDPPPAQLYARVAGSVLLIEAGSRTVIRVVQD